MNDDKKSFLCKCSDFLKNYQFCTVLQFALLNGFIWMLMSANYLRYVNFIHTSWGGALYSLIFTIGHMGVFSIGLWLVLQLCRFVGKRFFAFSAIFWGSLSIFLLFADIVVYSLYRFHINIPMLSLFCSPAAFELVELPFAMIIGIILIITAILSGEYLLFKVVHKFSCPKSTMAVLAAIAVSFGAFNVIHALAAFTWHQEIILRTDTLPLKYAMTATRFLTKHGLKQPQGIKIHAGSTIKYPLKKLEFKAMPKRKNIIVILVDSLRADMLNPEVMPNICNFAQTVPYARFTNHFSGGNCTKTGVFSLFYGIPGNYFDQALRSNAGAALIDSVVDLGYDVKAFSGGTLLAPPFNRTIFARVPDIEVTQTGRTKIERDISALKKCVNYLKTRDNSKPYFIFLFLDSVHGSAVAPGFPLKFATDMKQVNFLSLSNTEKNRKDALNMIKNSSYYIDDLLYKFFCKADIKKRITEDTVVVLTSDHGNEVGETEMKNWGHNSNFARYQTQSPLLILGLDRPNQVVSYKTSGLDVSGTLMQDVLGCTNDMADYCYGKNLFDPAEREFIFSSSYLETAMIYQDKVFVQTVYGLLRKYTLDGKIIDDPLPPAAIKKFFEMSSKYSK